MVRVHQQVLLPFQLAAMCGETAHECVRATISMFMRFHCELKCVFVHRWVCAGL